MNTKKLAMMSVLLSCALIIFIIESALPPIAPIPGIKMGLANIITLVSLIWLKKRDTFVILILRIVMGAVFSGNMMSMVYSMCGGVLSFAVMAMVLRILTDKQLWLVSVTGAIAHNIGQIVAAVFITSTWQVINYLPILIVSAVITGVFTGVIAGEIIKRKDIRI